MRAEGDFGDFLCVLIAWSFLHFLDGSYLSCKTYTKLTVI